MTLFFKFSIFWSLSAVSGGETMKRHDDPLDGVMKLQEVCQRLYQKKCPDGSCVHIFKKCDFDKPPFPGGIYCEWDLCDDGTCISPYHGCSGECGIFKKRCPDGSCADHLLDPCPSYRCPTFRPHSCGGGSQECYRDSDKCNGVKDCTNGYDENGCSGQSESKLNNVLTAIGIPCMSIAAFASIYYKCTKKSSSYACGSNSSLSSTNGDVTSPSDQSGRSRIHNSRGSRTHQSREARIHHSGGTRMHQSSGTRMQPMVISYDFTSTTPTHSTNISASGQGAEPHRTSGEHTPLSPSLSEDNSGGPPVYGAHEAFPLLNPGAVVLDTPPPVPPPSYDEYMARYIPPKQEPG